MNHATETLGMESKLGENFLSLQCKDKGEGGGLMISLVKILSTLEEYCSENAL